MNHLRRLRSIRQYPEEFGKAIFECVLKLNDEVPKGGDKVVIDGIVRIIDSVDRVHKVAYSKIVTLTTKRRNNNGKNEETKNEKGN